MPLWLVWSANLIVFATLSALVYFLNWSGTAFTAGGLFGFFLCYVLYRNWRQDCANEDGAHFTD